MGDEMDDTQPERRCAICDTRATKKNPLLHEWADEYLCFNDFTSESGKQWRDNKRREDPAYDRYKRLLSLGGPRQCPVCGFGMRLRLKAGGMGAGIWEVSCTTCYRVNYDGISAYRMEQELGYNAVSALETAYETGQVGDEELEEAIGRLAKVYDATIRPTQCECDGHFSLAAKPRCARCASVLLDTYFCYAWSPETNVV